MLLLKNYMEELVKGYIDKMLDKTGCCTCEHCKMDVTAIALNNLKPIYVVTPLGEVYAKANYIAVQYEADIVSAITAAADIVRRSPRHSTPQQ